MKDNLIQAPAETDKPSGDHPVSEFKAKAREIWDKICWSDVKGADALPIIVTALAEAVAGESAALRHDLERSIARETEHVNRIEAFEKALKPFVDSAKRLGLDILHFDEWPNHAQVVLRVTAEDVRRAFLVSALSQGDRTASVSDQRELET